jgi:hypothetical protein
MTDITPPPELVQQWRNEEPYEGLLSRAAQYGADQELEACCEYLVRCAQWEPEDVAELRTARRPKPPSLAEQALELVDRIEKAESVWNMRELDTIRAALERLQELENGNE